MARYRKRPIEIEAVEWNGTNCAQVFDFLGIVHGPHDDDIDEVIIPTPEGDMTASIGDWIIRGVAGEFYPCKPSIFAATYDPV